MNSRITAIGLERRDRWEACEKHLRSVLPPEVEFDHHGWVSAKDGGRQRRRQGGGT